jgi:hypothetical protein
MHSFCTRQFAIEGTDWVARIVLRLIRMRGFQCRSVIEALHASDQEWGIDHGRCQQSANISGPPRCRHAEQITYHPPHPSPQKNIILLSHNGI